MIRWEDLDDDQRSVLANAGLTKSYAAAYDSLVRLGLIDSVSQQNTAAGDEVLFDARRRGLDVELREKRAWSQAMLAYLGERP